MNPTTTSIVRTVTGGFLLLLLSGCYTELIIDSDEPVAAESPSIVTPAPEPLPPPPPPEPPIYDPGPPPITIIVIESPAPPPATVQPPENIHRDEGNVRHPSESGSTTPTSTDRRPPRSPRG